MVPFENSQETKMIQEMKNVYAAMIVVAMVAGVSISESQNARRAAGRAWWRTPDIW